MDVAEVDDVVVVVVVVVVVAVEVVVVISLAVDVVDDVVVAEHALQAPPSVGLLVQTANQVPVLVLELANLILDGSHQIHEAPAKTETKALKELCLERWLGLN
jgi:hypothetical protein